MAKEITLTPEQQKLVIEIEKIITVYNQVANRLRGALVFFGTIGIGVGLFVTAFAGSNFLKAGASDSIYVRIASFISALYLTALTAFNVTAKGNNARNAFRYLEHAYSMYRIGKYSLKQLINAGAGC